LLSEKGKIVFSGEYRQAVLATPHLKCRTSLIAWIALALILVLAGCIIYGVTSRAR